MAAHRRRRTPTARDVEDAGLQATLAEVLERDDVRVLRATQDRRAAEREQWNDADNYLAVAPGVVVGYERNTDTNRLLPTTASRSCRSSATSSAAAAAEPAA